MLLSHLARLEAEAIIILREVAAAYKALDAKAELGDVLMRLSRVAKKRGDLRSAERYASQAYAVSRPNSANIEV